MNTIPAPDAYRKRLSEMLDLTYELEGLLHIGVARSSVPPRLNQLIVDKINSLVALADAPAETEGLNSDLDDGYSEIDEDDLMEFPAMTPSAEEEKTAEGEMSEESGYMHGASAEAAEEYVAEPSEIKEEAEQYETAAEEEKIGNTIIDGNIADEEVEDIKEGDIKEGDIKEEKDLIRLDDSDNEMEYESEDQPDTATEYSAEDDEPEEEPIAVRRNEEEITTKNTSGNNATNTSDTNAAGKPENKGANIEFIARTEIRTDEPPRPKGGRLFSVNDRFLYARELFGGNLKNFDAAIDGVITLDNYDEAEEYFVSEWGIDAESSTGMRFLATIMKMF